VKVLYITEQNLEVYGGARSHVLGFCEGLIGNGHKVKIITPFVRKGRGRDRGILTKIVHIVKLYSMRNRIISLVEVYKPDIIYFRKGYFDFPFIFLSKTNKYKIIVEVNGIPGASVYFFERVVAPFLLFIFDRRKFLKADMIVSVSEGIKNHLITRYKTLKENKVIVVNNGVNTEIFKPKNIQVCRQALKVKDSEFMLVFSGRVAQWHGVDLILHAIALLKDKKYFPNIKFYIVGTGPALPFLKSLTNDLNLEGSVVFSGMQTQEVVADYINSANLCLAPFTMLQNNKTQISPLKIFEYIACGKVIVTTKVSGISDIFDEVKNYPVYIIKPDSPKELAGLLCELIEKNPGAIIPPVDVIKNISWSNKTEYILRQIENK
jgi:glycosyltransferase involved in cell wall biosynthesis